jgi:polyisoprenoid-binding protein YceI
MKKSLFASVLLGMSTLAPVQAADYVIDTEKAHAFIDFRIQHLGYSWMSGRFNDFKGTFSYDADAPQDSKIDVQINVESIDTNHAERDKHLRGKKFLDTSEFPNSRFVADSFDVQADGTMLINGQFTLHGVTKPMTITAEKVGEGQDPWGGYRAGFTGTTTIKMADYDIDAAMLGPASQEVYLTLSIEGIRK